MPTDDEVRAGGPNDSSSPDSSSPDLSTGDSGSGDLSSVDDQLRVLVRLWRWDRIDGLKAASRRELAAVDRLLDRRLELTRARLVHTNVQQTTDLQHCSVDDHVDDQRAAGRAQTDAVDDHDRLTTPAEQTS